MKPIFFLFFSCFFSLNAQSSVEFLDKNEKVDQFFSWVVERDFQKLLSFLEEQPHVINLKDGEGETALHRATARRDKEMVQFLLSQGALPNIKNNEKESSFYLAVRKRYYPMIEIFIASERVDLNLANTNGNTVFHKAAQMGQRYIMLHLLKALKETYSLQSKNYKKTLNQKNHKGKTAFRIALERGDFPIAERLVEYGADFFISDEIGMKFLNRFVERGDLEIVKIILKHMKVSFIEINNLKIKALRKKQSSVAVLLNSYLRAKNPHPKKTNCFSSFQSSL